MAVQVLITSTVSVTTPTAYQGYFKMKCNIEPSVYPPPYPLCTNGHFTYPIYHVITQV